MKPSSAKAKGRAFQQALMRLLLAKFPQLEKESDYYNLELADKVCEELLKQAQEQYQLPNWIMDYLWDGCNTTCEQYTFTKLVKNNKDTKEEYLGHCEQCGDMIYRWTLELDIS